jgi:3-isopropylmalate/(R)-2-methylmalate dehydratase small subunit
VPGFADIFRSNSVKNGLLTIELAEEEVDRIFNMVNASEGLQATVELPAQQITIQTPDPIAISFDIDKGSKERLVGGLDDIAISLQYEADITRFEKTHELFLAANT